MKSALVTGGASGLGEATVRRLAKSGFFVVIVDKNAEKGAALAKELGVDTAAFVNADVTNEAEIKNAIDVATKKAPLRAAVACAGVGWAARTLSKDGTPHDLELYRTIITVNLLGTFNVLRLSAASMSKNEPNADGERGVVICTASAAAFDGQIGQVAYSASKAGVVGMTLPAARDLAPVGVRVLTIAPGTFDTPMLGALPEPAREALRANIPFPRRLGRPEEYAALVEHITQNSYLNAEVIRIDGALRMPPK